MGLEAFAALPVASAVGDCPSIGDRDHNQQSATGPSLPAGVRPPRRPGAQHPLRAIQPEKSQVRGPPRTPVRRAYSNPLPTRPEFGTVSDVCITERGHYSDPSHAGVTLVNPAAGGERREAGWGLLMIDNDWMIEERG